MPDNFVPQRSFTDSADSSLERDRALGSFLRSLAHELGNIAFPLRMIIELQSRAGRLSAAEFEDVLQNQIAALQSITRRLQAIGRCLSADMTATLEPLPAADIIAGATESQRDAAQQRGQTLSVNADDGTVLVIGDRELLIEALAELVHNAVCYTPAGGRIEVAVKADGPGVEFAVRDNGPGVPPELLPRIFEPFVIGGERMEIGAGHLGCGLALVRRIMDVHRGTVEVRRASATGTEFVMAVPGGASAAP